MCPAWAALWVSACVPAKPYGTLQSLSRPTGPQVPLRQRLYPLLLWCSLSVYWGWWRWLMGYIRVKGSGTLGSCFPTFCFAGSCFLLSTIQSWRHSRWGAQHWDNSIQKGSLWEFVWCRRNTSGWEFSLVSYFPGEGLLTCKTEIKTPKCRTFAMPRASAELVYMNNLMLLPGREWTFGGKE